MTCNMEMEKKHGKINQILLENMLMDKKTVKELIITLTDLSMKEIG